MQFDILQAQSVDLPEGLVGIHDLYVLQFHVPHLAEELRAIDAAAAHDEVVGIPDGRARPLGKVTVFYQCAVDVPPRVLAIEAAVGSLHVLALFDARLSIRDGDVLQARVF